MSEVSVERCLLEMPYEILFEIFRRIPKGKLIELSRLCSKFWGVAGDTRVWKDVCIKYEPNKKSTSGSYAFEELYSGPWPVKLVDLSEAKIDPPISSQTDQAVKVNKLVLSSIGKDKVTMEAILDKYQCTELYFVDKPFSPTIKIISSEAFSKQIALEALSVRFSLVPLSRMFNDAGKPVLRLSILPYSHSWLEQVLNNCKNLKTLDLSFIYWSKSEMLHLVRNLPTSLEKLLIADVYPEDSFFKSLAESIPNLKELKLSPHAVKCPSLLNFQFLGVVQLIPFNYSDISDVCKYLIRFPALKTVYLFPDSILKNIRAYSLERELGKLRTALEPHGIYVRPNNMLVNAYPPDGTFTLWNVSNTMFSK